MEGLHISNLRKTFGNYFGSFALGPIDFDVDAGYIVAVIGKNGSGKSTLFDCMLGVLRHEGSMEWRAGDANAGCTDINAIDGTRADRTTMNGTYGDSAHSGGISSADSIPAHIKTKISFVIEHCPFPEHMSANEIRRCYGCMYKDFDRKKYDDMCRRYNVPMNRPVKKLSRGMTMIVQTAFAFSHYSEILILDEPTAHLDNYARKEFYELVSGYAAEEGHMVFWSSHVMGELDRMADYVLGIKGGKQMFFMTKEELCGRYHTVGGSRQQLDYIRKALVGRNDGDSGSSGLVDTRVDRIPVKVVEEPAGLADIVEYLL